MKVCMECQKPITGLSFTRGRIVLCGACRFPPEDQEYDPVGEAIHREEARAYDRSDGRVP